LPTVAIYAAVGGQQTGPHDAGAIVAMISSGQLTRDTLVWKRGLTEWIAASKMPELASHFESAPPPLPK
jgi:hypothetical protein